MEIIRFGSRPSGKVPSDWFTGAVQSTAMTHIAIQEALDGKVVDWMEQVSDQQYLA